MLKNDFFPLNKMNKKPKNRTEHPTRFKIMTDADWTTAVIYINGADFR